MKCEKCECENRWVNNFYPTEEETTEFFVCECGHEQEVVE